MLQISLSKCLFYLGLLEDRAKHSHNEDNYIAIYITESIDVQLQHSIAFSLMYELEFSNISKGI